VRRMAMMKLKRAWMMDKGPPRLRR
jgi:hypothetical protein